MSWELPLEVVLGMVAVGVPAVVCLAHLTGGSRGRELGEAAVRELLEREEGVTVLDVVGGRTASGWTCVLARARPGARSTRRSEGLWVVWAMESHLAARQVPPGGLRRAGEGVEVDLGDPGWPSVVVGWPEGVPLWQEVA